MVKVAKKHRMLPGPSGIRLRVPSVPSQVGDQRARAAAHNRSTSRSTASPLRIRFNCRFSCFSGVSGSPHRLLPHRLSPEPRLHDTSSAARTSAKTETPSPAPLRMVALQRAVFPCALCAPTAPAAAGSIPKSQQSPKMALQKTNSKQKSIHVHKHPRRSHSAVLERQGRKAAAASTSRPIRKSLS